MNNCSHVWSTNSGKGGMPVFGYNGEYPMRVACFKCDSGDFYTIEQWESMQPKLKTERPRPTTFTCSFCHQENCDISHDCC